MNAEEYNQRLDNRIKSFEEEFSKNFNYGRKVLKEYAATFQYRFIPLVSQAAASAHVDEAKQLMLQNLKEEIEEDHPGMLQKMLKSGNIELTVEDHIQGTHNWLEITPWLVYTDKTKDKMGLGLITIMSALENASTVFIPKLREYAQENNVTDFTYLDVHGIADIEHAKQARQAVIAEAEYVGANSGLIQYRATSDAFKLLHKIFFMH